MATNILRHIDNLVEQAANAYKKYKDSDPDRAERFGLLAVNLWNSRVVKTNELQQQVWEDIKKDIADDH